MLLNILLALLIVVAVSLTAIVLLQRSEGGALGMGGGGGQLMSARGAGNLLTKITQILGAIFFILALLITILTGREASSGSVVDRLKIQGIDPTLLNKQQAPAPAQAPSDALPGASGGFFPAPAPSTGLTPAPVAPTAAAPAPTPATTPSHLRRRSRRQKLHRLRSPR